MTSLDTQGGPGGTSPASIRRRRLGVVALLGLAIAALVVLGQSRRVNELSVLFIQRDKNSSAENAMRVALEDLIASHNDRKGVVRLKLDTRVSFEGKELAQIYRDPGAESRVVAILDNSWGIELARPDAQKAREALKCPIVFLNGDRFESADVGPWIFLGASDHIPAQLSAIVRDVRGKAAKAGAGGSTDVNMAYFVERDSTDKPYPAAEQALADIRVVLPQAGGKAGLTVINLPCDDGWRLPDRNTLTRARSDLLAAMPDHAGEQRKVVVMFTHSSWGTELLRWIDTTFRNTTIVAYQSSQSRDRPVPLREGTGNELVILSQSSTAAPRALVEMHDRLRPHHPELLTNRALDLFYLRRALVAFELVANTIRANRAQANSLGVPEVQRLIAQRGAGALAAIKGKSFTSSIGLLTFDANGVELGNNHIVLRRGKLTDSYPAQLNERDQFLPNLQVLLSHVRITDLDIREGTIRLSLILHVRCAQESLLSKFSNKLDQRRAGVGDPQSQGERSRASSLDPVPQLSDLLEDLLRFGDVDGSELTRTFISSSSSGRLTELQYSISGKCRLEEMEPWWYPFDVHTVRLPLSVLEPTSLLRVSIDQRQRETLDRLRDSEVSGWRLLDIGVNIDHRASGSALESDAMLAASVQTQFSAIDLNLVVRRRSWSVFVLVYLPLAVISVGSTAVLFIELGSSPDPRANAEILRTQSELSLVCVLAVVTYLVSYAGFVPRMERPLYCDLLLGATLVIVSVNFAFIVAIAARTSNRLFTYLTVPRYRGVSALASVAMFGLWPLLGMMFT